MQKSKTSKKLTASIGVIILLSVCLAITTVALALSMVSVEDNLFLTGTVKINLNNGKPVIEEHEFLFEPGMTVKKDFFIKNESSCNVYYKLYFNNVSGRLSDVIQIEIKNNNKVLFKGTPKQLTSKKLNAADDILKVNEKRDLQIYFHFPSSFANNTQNRYLTFDLAADAVQTKNNPNREF